MFYGFAKCVMWIGMHVLYRIKVVGKDNIPADGSFIICANHSDNMDPIIIAIGIRRRLYFMGKKELFKQKFFSFILGGLGVFPIDREASADMKAFKRSLEILKGGNGLLLFAQGRRMKEFADMKNGAALFALKSGSPIVPVGINAGFKFFTKVTVKIGRPISMEQHKDKKLKSALLDEIMEDVSDKIKELMA